jgi:hypothetical protein
MGPRDIAALVLDALLVVAGLYILATTTSAVLAVVMVVSVLAVAVSRFFKVEAKLVSLPSASLLGLDHQHQRPKFHAQDATVPLRARELLAVQKKHVGSPGALGSVFQDSEGRDVVVEPGSVAADLTMDVSAR